MNWQDFQWMEKQVAAILAAIKNMEAKMGALDDRITTITAAVTQLGTDLTAAIADLKAKIAAGQPTDAQLAALDAIATSLTTLDTQAKAE